MATTEPMSRLDKAAIGLVIFALLYFGGHAVVAGMKGNLSVQAPTTTTTVDEWPDCRAACHSPAAAEAVQRAHEDSGWTCWAEDNDEMPEGYEILCRQR